jgi:hypothetical protein
VGTLIFAASAMSIVPNRTVATLAATRAAGDFGSNTPRMVLGVVKETAIAYPSSEVRSFQFLVCRPEERNG